MNDTIRFRDLGETQRFNEPGDRLSFVSSVTHGKGRDHGYILVSLYPTGDFDDGTDVAEVREISYDIGEGEMLTHVARGDARVVGGHAWGRLGIPESLGISKDNRLVTAFTDNMGGGHWVDFLVFSRGLVLSIDRECVRVFQAPDSVNLADWESVLDWWDGGLETDSCLELY